MELLLAGMALSLLLTLLGLLLGTAAQRWPEAQTDNLVTALDAALPQWQCGQCGYPGCRPYASAIAAGTAAINQCPPGGDATIVVLAELLNCAPLPLNTHYGTTPPPQVAVIREADCIGCVLCIKACPVDAIIGAPKQLHTVLTIHCTGCALCLPPCPMDCIELHPADTAAF